jgi:hypothetical protein
MRSSSVLPALLLGFILILVMSSGQAAWPDDLGVSGTVVDGDGAPMDGVNITAMNVTSGGTVYTFTDDEGVYDLRV